MGLPQTYRGIKKWVERNPVTKAEKNCNTYQQNATNRKYVFSDGTGHRINDYTEVKDPVKRRQIVNLRKLCFNCL